MLILLSPSKTLDYTSPYQAMQVSEPKFVRHAQKLVDILKKSTPGELALLMNISSNLAELTALRYQNWHYPFSEKEARPAIFAFKGDVYDGLKARELNSRQLDFANHHIRILSGLYGILKPNDTMLAYRLEMGTNIAGKGFSNLYQFWGDSISKSVKKAIKESGSNTLINLASEEYSRAVDFKATKSTIITPVFKEFRNGAYKFISYNGKRARGMMTRFIIDKEITHPEQIKLFDYEGYEYMEQLSTDEKWVFVR